MINLGTLGGAACPICNSGGNGPNASGESAIGLDTATLDPMNEDFCGDGTHHQCLGAIWRHGRLTALPTLPGGHNADAFGLNNHGQVIGFSENGVHDPSCATLTPFQVTRFEFWSLRFECCLISADPLQTQTPNSNPKLKTQNSKLKTQNHPTHPAPRCLCSRPPERN